MRRHLVALWLAAATIAVPGVAWAARLTETEAGPPMGTTVYGFTEVVGPGGAAPEHAGTFAPAPACLSCPASGHSSDRGTPSLAPR